MTTITKTIERIEAAVEKFSSRGIQELIDQGHVATSRLINSFEVQIDATQLDRIRATITTLDYGIDVDTGTSALEVRKKGRRHLLDLLNWIAVIKPNLRPAERQRFARNAARAHRREGVPTKASRRFSKNGERTGWIDRAYEDKEALEMLEDDLLLVESIAEQFDQLFANPTRE